MFWDLFLVQLVYHWWALQLWHHVFKKNKCSFYYWVFLQWSQAWLQTPQADQPCNLLTSCFWEGLPSWSCSELRGVAVPSPHSCVLHGPIVSVWRMVTSSQSLPWAGKRLLCTCASGIKGLLLLCKKVFGRKKRKRNEPMIPASWNFPYSDSFVALDSGPWLSAHQFHLPEMQPGVFCGFWFCWVFWLVGYFVFVFLFCWLVGFF